MRPGLRRFPEDMVGAMKQRAVDRLSTPCRHGKGPALIK